MVERDQRKPRSRSRQWGVVFVVALMARGGWGLVRLARVENPSALEFPDEQQYWLMASSLHAGEGLRDELGFRATRMPLYPAALSLLADFEHGISIAKAIQWLLGAFMAACTACAAAELLGHRVGWAAGLIVAFDPFLIFFSSLLLTETLFRQLRSCFGGPLCRSYKKGRRTVLSGDGSVSASWRRCAFSLKRRASG